MNPALSRFPEHARLMGLMVLSYPELILMFSHCVGLALGLKYDALDALFEISSEKTRVQAGKALAARKVEQRGLTLEWTEVTRALQTCADIRNVYAHGNLADEGNRLFIAQGKLNLEAGFRRSEITAVLLQSQAAYFGYTRTCLLHLEWRLQDMQPPSPFPQRMQPPLARNPAS